MAATRPLRLEREAVVRLWLERQGLSRPRGSAKLTKSSLTRLLEQTGGLQLDSVNVLERAHYLTLWSRFGAYDRTALDRWIHRDRIAYEYWGHEASILPRSHLSISARRMRRFPGPWVERAWWPRFETSATSKRRVLRRLREEGPLESADFERTPEAGDEAEFYWGAGGLPKEDKRSLKLLWHAGKVAVAGRRHFRCLFDLAERVYPEVAAARQTQVEDHWLHQGLEGNGIASERHLVNYLTTPELKAADRRRILERHRRRKALVEVQVEGVRGTCYARPEALERLARAPAAHGTTLLSPFDSLLWQRARAEELLGFNYRIEIYTPAAKRRFGYYVLPILHDGHLVGRLDPKLHRDAERLQVVGLELEPGFRSGEAFEAGLAGALGDLAAFVGARSVELPKRWKRRIRL